MNETVVNTVREATDASGSGRDSDAGKNAAARCASGRGCRSIPSDTYRRFPKIDDRELNRSTDSANEMMKTNESRVCFRTTSRCPGNRFAFLVRLGSVRFGFVENGRAQLTTPISLTWRINVRMFGRGTRARPRTPHSVARTYLYGHVRFL